MFSKARNSQIVDEAADWAIRIDAGGMAGSEKEALAAWLRESPRHVEELLTMASIFSGFEDVDPQRRLSVDDILDRVAGNVTPLSNNPGTESACTLAEHKRYTRPLGFVAAIACVALILTFFYVGGPSDNQLYSTVLGEQRSVLLDDGSIVHVNTQSEVQVEYTESERRIILLSGEAMFDVKKDPHRPFRVVANNSITEAIGTRFNVRYRDSGISVVVLEGQVAVATEDDIGALVNTGALILDRGRVLLASGEKVDIPPASGGSVVVAEADIVATESWRLRQLVFESESLSNIAREFNRYNRVQIVVLDDRAARHEFSGLFQADDPWSFVDFLKLTGNVLVEPKPGQIHLKSPPRKPSAGRK